MRQGQFRTCALIGIIGATIIDTAGMAQTAPPATPAPTPQADSVPPETADEIVVRGHHVLGSAVGDIEPVAILDADALKALGATSTRELLTRLKGLATSGAGGEPAMLLNGRRIASVDDLYSLPFEAIDRTEILSEQDAARLGFPPTVRVMNFITKKHFRSIQLLAVPSIDTDGGGTTNYAEVNATRIENGRRASVSGSYFHQGNILQSQRDIVPDPTVPYAVQGNVVGATGGSIDPALDALAGRAVTIAAVPTDPTARRLLGSYAASSPAITDIGPYRTLQPTLDRLHFDATLARPVGKVDLSVNLSAQQEWTAGLNGLASGAIAVPAGSSALPFATPVVIDRYFPVVLAQHGSVQTLHGGVTAQGGLGRWAWSVTGRYDRVVNRFTSDTGVPLDALQATVAAGGDPIQPLDPGSAAERIVQRSETRTDTVAANAVANGPLLSLPAGDALVTLTTGYTHSASQLNAGNDTGSSGQPFARTLTSATASIDVPIASADRGVLAFAGRLGVNALVGVTAVSNYGRLATTNIGFNWTPSRPVQLLGSINEARTAPAINLLVDPQLVTPNVPVFDYVTGTSVLVTTTSGGNPALAPERRRVDTLSLAVKPFAKKEIRLTIDLVDTLVEGQTASLANVTQPFQTAFGDLFQRNAAGTLVGIDLRPVNLASEREQKLHWSLSGNTTIGRTPPHPPAPAPGQPPPPLPKPRLALYAFLNGNYRFSDRLALRDGVPTLDLLDGASLTGSGGRPRWDVDGTIGGGYGAINFGLYSQLQGPTRIRSDLASADLRFSARTNLLYYTDIDLGAVIKRPWTKRLSANFAVENLLDNRIAVRDRTGATPNRFQSAYLDPVGRSVRVALRKLF